MKVNEKEKEIAKELGQIDTLIFEKMIRQKGFTEGYEKGRQSMRDEMQEKYDKLYKKYTKLHNFLEMLDNTTGGFESLCDCDNIGGYHESECISQKLYKDYENSLQGE